MNPFEEALAKVVEVMLDQNNCKAENSIIRDKLVTLLRNKLRDIAVTTSYLASHAGRTAPDFFDVECAFRRLNISACELREFRYAKAQKYPPVVKFNAFHALDVDIHQKPVHDIIQELDHRDRPHIPQHIPPFPGLHTYKHTKPNIVTDRSYLAERERSAKLNQSAQRALNKFYLRTEPKVSLFNEPQSGEEFMVLISNGCKKPAYLSALKPRNEVFDFDIYEFNDQPSGLALTNSFLKKAKEYYVKEHPPIEINEDQSKSMDVESENTDNEQEYNQDVEKESKQGSNAKDDEKENENAIASVGYCQMPSLDDDTD